MWCQQTWPDFCGCPDCCSVDACAHSVGRGLLCEGSVQAPTSCHFSNPLLLPPPCPCRPKLCYTIPIHNNPTGATIPLEKRIRLLQLAHQHDFVLLCDEVYQLLTFDGSPPPPPPMRAVECSLLEQGLLPCSSASSNALTPGRQQQAAAATPAEANSTASSSSSGVSTQCESRVVSLGSFSKIMAPGLRLGWVDAAAPFLQMLRRDGVLGSGGSIAPLASGIAHSCLELGLLQQHMHGTVRPALQRNCAALCEALRQHLPAGCNFRQPDGGYFVWLHLPDEVRPAVCLSRQLSAWPTLYAHGPRCCCR